MRHPASTRHPSLFRASPCEKIRCLAFVGAVDVDAADGGGAVVVGFAGAGAYSFHLYLDVVEDPILLEDAVPAAADLGIAVAAARAAADGPAATVVATDDADAVVDTAAVAVIVAAKTYRRAKGAVLDSFQ